MRLGLRSRQIVDAMLAANGVHVDGSSPHAMIPAVIRDVEVTQPLTAVSAHRGGRRIGQIWLLVRYCTEPLGVIREPIPPGGLGPAEIGRAIGARLGQAIAARSEAYLETCRRGGQLPPVPAAGLDMPRHSTYLAGRARALEVAPSITVVICTRNRPASLRRALDSLRRQDYPRFKVMVVDSAPADESTSTVARSAASSMEVEYLRVPEPGLARARNAAVRAARGETIAWLDDDEVVDDYWLGEIARGLIDWPEADILCGSVIPAELESPAQVWFEEFGGLVKGRGFSPAEFSPNTRGTFNPLFPLPPFGAGANMVTRPGVVESAGWFDTALGAGTPARGGEDTLFFMEVLRAGGTLVYQPSILARHYHRRDLAELRRQLMGYGVGLTAAYCALVRRHPSVVAGLGPVAVRASRELFGRGSVRTATIGPDFPSELLRDNRRAMLSGPIAYLRGLRAAAGSEVVTD